MFEKNKIYRNILILQSRNCWDVYLNKYDVNQDVVLTFDFGLKREIESLGGTVFYIDHLCAQTEMQENNFLAADFFKNWHYDKNGKDIFIEKGISFGFAFRIEIWSEYLYYVRLRACLGKLRLLQYSEILLCEENGTIENILREMDLKFVSSMPSSTMRVTYFFDIHRYMYEALHGKNIRGKVRDAIVKIVSNINFIFDKVFYVKCFKKTIYAQIYHPTKNILEKLKHDADIRVVTSSLTTSLNIKSFFLQRLIPINGRLSAYESPANTLLSNFKDRRYALLRLTDGTDITASAYDIIEQQIRPRVPEALRIISSVLKYIKKVPIDLEIMIANIGLLQTVVDCVLKENGVPSYLIINGLMTGQFCDEAKYATVINGYSESIKKHYFHDNHNVVTLGDPRMDQYAMRSKPQSINRTKPTISIGTSGFNNLDLNSYVAVEFDFMFDVLSTFLELHREGVIFNLIIKVRPNGIAAQYREFVNEYFPTLEIEILKEVSISQVLCKTDLYISIYSQTLFEASCLGIPVIYYKKDTEILDPPFDQNSELVTIGTAIELKQAFFDFVSDHDRFKAFQKKSVMEKYVGPLDGKNLERNLTFIYGLLKEQGFERVSP
ncbi:MAG: hypothetical protein Q8R67_06640 [Rhodoferax sp.]|nr:hypothetical protein [Rhodoferax sp.]MDP3651343.1 hypothetical protein [Rhodoferax sp.]